MRSAVRYVLAALSVHGTHMLRSAAGEDAVNHCTLLCKGKACYYHARSKRGVASTVMFGAAAAAAAAVPWAYGLFAAAGRPACILLYICIGLLRNSG
jgi:hypothetical protein